MKLTGAEILAQVLIEQGVDTLFGYPGGSVLNIYDALYAHQDEIHHIITAHEQGAAHAADGYARASGKTGVVLATSGPGATNLVTGIATAFMDSVPMVAITGNVTSDLIGKDSFQEVYTVGITMPITKHNFMVTRVEDLADTLREAFRIAGSGRKGPVLVDITKDATAHECEFVPGERFAEHKTCNVEDEKVWEVLRYLGRSRRPLVLFGGGVVSSGAEQELYDLVHKMQLPCCHTLMANGVLSWDDPLNVGMVGMHGFFAGNKAIAEADLLLTVGFRFSDRVALNTRSFAKRATIVQIEIDPSEVNKNVQVDYAVVGDIQGILQKLLPMVETSHHDDWLAQIDEWRAQEYRPADSRTTLMPHQVMDCISQAAGEDGVLVTDVGQHQMWAAQYCRRTKPRHFLTSGGLGTMGFGYGAAIGAKFAAGDAPVIHITGDGSFHMNLNEVCTAVTYKLPVISVIFNNNVLGMVRQWQHTFYSSRFSSTTLERETDYVKVAEGFGATGYRCTNLTELQAALQAALQSDGPVWIDCAIDRNADVLPFIPSGRTVDDIILE